jgi:hypothetical protein
LMEEIMVGGKEGAEKLEQVLRQNAAASELAARKSILNDIAPAYEAVTKQVQALLQAQQQAAQEQVEARFFGAPGRSDYRQHADLCRSAAERLAREFPNEVSSMTEEEFFSEITKQVDYNLTRQAQALFGQGVTDWRQLRQQFAQQPAAAPAPAPAPAVIPAPAAPAPAATPAVSRTPVATPVSHQFGAPLPPAVVPPGNPAQAVVAPAINAPAGGVATGPQAPGWHHDVNERMRGGRRS